jgi:hypothetical protein
MLESLTLKDAGAGRVFVRPVIEIYVFSTAPRVEVFPGALDFHRELSRECKVGMHWYKTNVMKRAKELGVTGLVQHETCLKSLKPNSRMWGLAQHSGSRCEGLCSPGLWCVLRGAQCPRAALDEHLPASLPAGRARAGAGEAAPVLLGGTARAAAGLGLLRLFVLLGDGGLRG